MFSTFNKMIRGKGKAIWVILSYIEFFASERQSKMGGLNLVSNSEGICSIYSTEITDIRGQM